MTQGAKTGWRQLLFGNKQEAVCECGNAGVKKTTLKSEILEVLEETQFRFLAVHEIGDAIRAKGIFYNDPSVSACLRGNESMGGIRGKVVGQRRGNSLMKEWKLA